MFNGFYRPRSNFYRLPNDWFDIWADLRESTGRRRIFAPLKVTEYVIKWTWGYQNFDRPVRISRRTFQYGRRIGGEKRLDRGTNLSSRGLEGALSFLLDQGVIEEHLAEGEDEEAKSSSDGPAFLPRLRPDEDENVNEDEGFLGESVEQQPGEPYPGFERPASNYFKVPAIWTDLTHDVTSEAVILTTEYFFRHTWGWHGDGETEKPRWLDVDDVCNGRRYRSEARRGERYDRGIGYSERSVRDALNEGVERGWLVWREKAGYQGREYALHLDGMAVTADGRWIDPDPTPEDELGLFLGHPPATTTPPVAEAGPGNTEEETAQEDEESPPPVDPLAAENRPDDEPTSVQAEVDCLRTQVAALTHLVQALIALLREAGVDLDADLENAAMVNPRMEANAAPPETNAAGTEVSTAPMETSTAPSEASTAPSEASSAPGVAVSTAPSEVSTAPAEASTAGGGNKYSAYYTDTIKETPPTPPPDTAARATAERESTGKGHGNGDGGGGGGENSSSQTKALLTHLTTLDPPMSIETATNLIDQHGVEVLQAWLDALECDPTVRSVAALLTHKLKSGETPPDVSSRRRSERDGSDASPSLPPPPPGGKVYR